MEHEIKSAKIISSKMLRSVWKRISDKPLPDIYAYTLKDQVFLSTIKKLQRLDDVVDTRVKEYGLDFDNRFIEACTFEFKGHLIVFVKESVPLVDALEHELKHVKNWKSQNPLECT